jgi:prepilin-type N-terminal cleavage/methylation domain-containing protein
MRIDKKNFRTKLQKFQSGYSMLEMLLAMAVGSIVIAGSYASFVVISKQYQRIAAMSEMQSSGMPTLRLIARDLRMAGRVALDANLDPVYGTIATPIAITDSGNACCDSIAIIYDKSATERYRITYRTATRTTPTRNAIYMDKEQWTGGAWVAVSTGSLVADYVDDLQFVGSDNSASGMPRIVDISMILHGKSMQATSKLYTKPSQVAGNYSYSVTDNYKHDEFTTTVNIKNLR